MSNKHEISWASEEFENADLGDKRLNRRLMKICDSFSESPENPISQACEDWAGSKAAYRFFKNDKVKESEISEAHYHKTIGRARKHKTILAIQDTSYIIYTKHPKTEGLGKIALHKGRHVKEIFTYKRFGDAYMPGSKHKGSTAWIATSKYISSNIA